MANLDALVAVFGPRFGVLAESSTTQLTVIARNSDVAIGDLFILPCRRGPDRMYVFRATEYANILNRTIVMGDVARNKLTMPDSYFAEDLAEEHPSWASCFAANSEMAGFQSDTFSRVSSPSSQSPSTFR
jgi:hypothetical protein